ncbi:MAG: hypothetical protein ACREJU_08115 [Nitrospiraceae bacterium]
MSLEFAGSQPACSAAQERLEPNFRRDDGAFQTEHSRCSSLWRRSTKRLKRRDTITLDRVIALLASLSALCAALLAMFTLFEMQKQRRISLKPDIVPASLVAIRIDVDSSSPIPRLNAGSSKEAEGALYRVPVEVYNLGRGTAKRVSFTWRYDIDNLLSVLKKLDAEGQFTFELQNNTVKVDHEDGGVLLSVSFPSQIPFLPEYATATKPYTFEIPTDFLYLMRVYAYLRGKRTDDSVAYLPNGTLQIDYFDIDNVEHSQSYSIDLSSMELEKIRSRVRIEMNLEINRLAS